MELGLREWLAIFGMLVVVVVLCHGVWEMRRRAKSRIKLSVGKGIDINAFPPDESCGGELLGTARVVELPDADDDTPVLMHAADAEPRISVHAGFSARDEEQVPEMPGTAARWAADLMPDLEESPVVVMYVLGRSGNRFGGQEILQVLLACGLQYGEMNIFHRHAGIRGEGGLQFSVANAVEPGVFDLDRMNELATPGLSFFMEMRPSTDAVQAFEYMYETANYMANKLGGQMCDERRQPLEKESVERYRLMAQAYEARQTATAV